MESLGLSHALQSAFSSDDESDRLSTRKQDWHILMRTMGNGRNEDRCPFSHSLFFEVIKLF